MSRCPQLERKLKPNQYFHVGQATKMMSCNLYQVVSLAIKTVILFMECINP